MTGISPGQFQKWLPLACEWAQQQEQHILDPDSRSKATHPTSFRDDVIPRLTQIPWSRAWWAMPMPRKPFRVGLLSAVVATAAILISGLAGAAEPETPPPAERRLNNLVSELLDISAISQPSAHFKFQRPTDGWIFISASGRGTGTVRVVLDNDPHPVIVLNADGRGEAMRHVTGGTHAIRVECQGDERLNELVVRAIPELIHCGLGFNPEIKSYGVYDLDFLKMDILPNVTTLVVPNNIQLSESAVADWHRQGKRFVGEVGIDSQAKSAEDHFQYWSGFFDRVPFLDGIIINEFIVNRPMAEWVEVMTPERQARVEQERQQYEWYGEALKNLRGADRYGSKMTYAYVGGSGKKLNREVIGTNFIRTLLDCGYRVALERYLHEMSSVQGSQAALRTFVDGITDWETKEPGVERQMVIVFGLFSMPPGGINKQPNVDYHVWMDQQMNAVAKHPAMAGLAGLEWWTSTLADEETVRFVGKLYRHYTIEGKTAMLTRDPLFLTHLQNADFEKGTEGWTLDPAEAGSIAAKSFPRYGRIEGRYMGLGRPADPEHIGDTFLWMKRSAKGPNRFSQAIRDLEPGRLYSMKMFSCDYNDLVNPEAKTRNEALPFTGSVVLEGVEVDAKRSFAEMYSSNPEPKIPVWITYHWKVFRARDTTARLVVSDWPDAKGAGDAFGQEQTFNFLEIQPYWE